MLNITFVYFILQLIFKVLGKKYYDSINHFHDNRLLQTNLVLSSLTTTCSTTITSFNLNAFPYQNGTLVYNFCNNDSSRNINQLYIYSTSTKTSVKIGLGSYNAENLC